MKKEVSPSQEEWSKQEYREGLKRLNRPFLKLLDDFRIKNPGYYILDDDNPNETPASRFFDWAEKELKNIDIEVLRQRLTDEEALKIDKEFE